LTGPFRRLFFLSVKQKEVTMQGSSHLYGTAADAIAGGPLLQADARIKVHLVAADFTESNVLSLGDLPPDSTPTFSGYAPITTGNGAANVGIDPVSRNYRLELLEPAGGFRWETASDTDLPQTIFGWFAQSTTDPTALLFIERFAQPITLDGVGQVIEIPRASIDLLRIGLS
jgi:hypothetical protein